jgi:UDP-3-O-[3-hydroxymyristoyl] glucosamine N-acyltransferase
MTYTLEDLARFLGAQASETPGPEITGVKPLEHSREGDITYVANNRFLGALENSSARAVILPPNLDDPGERPFIRTLNPEVAFARLTSLFYPYEEQQSGISPKADVHQQASFGENVSIGPFAVVEKGTYIGDRTVIGAHTVIGEDVRVGTDTRIFPHVTVYRSVIIGDRVIIHSGSVIGADGFGFAPDLDQDGTPITVKKYHSGTVEIGDDVEIGALCGIDRALAGSTRLGKGVKLDNHVHVAHSVTIGSGTVIAAQTGIAGSSSVGAGCIMGGQVGIKDHVTVGDRVILATRVGIYRNVPDGSVMAGSVPAMPHKVFLRAQSLFKRLPEILERVKNLERQIKTGNKENT